MPYWITQCYLPPSSRDFPPLSRLKLVLDLASPEGCKAELTQVMVTSQDGLPAKDGHSHVYALFQCDLFSSVLCSKMHAVGYIPSGNNLL